MNPMTAEPPHPKEIAAMLANYSVECAPRADRADELARFFPPATDIYIPFLPGQDLSVVAASANAVRRAGRNPVPHIAARQVPSHAALGELLARLNGEAQVTRIMLIAGDSQLVHGPFAQALPIIESGLLQRHGITHVNVAGHPEGGSYLSREAGFGALKRKLAAADGLTMTIVTQFCFEAAPILAYLDDLRANGITAPARIGVAGPASPATLLKFALRCGVGNSLRALRPGIGRFGRLLNLAGPDEVVEGLARAPARPDGQIEGLHFFAFGGIRKASDWIGAHLGAAASA